MVSECGRWVDCGHRGNYSGVSAPRSCRPSRSFQQFVGSGHCILWTLLTGKVATCVLSPRFERRGRAKRRHHIRTFCHCVERLFPSLRRSRSHRVLIIGEEHRVLDRTVMVHLAPAAIDKLKNSRSADVEVLFDATVDVGAALAPYRPKQVASAMDRVIPEYDMNVGWTFEDALVHLVRLVGAAANSAKRIVDRD